MMLTAAWLETCLAKRLHDTAAVSVYCRRLTGEAAFSYGSRQMPSASLIKVPIMVSAFRQAEAGTLAFDQMYPLSQPVEGGSFYLSSAGEKVTVRRLLEHMIVESDNTCTNTLIRILGMARIQEEIERQGMGQTKLQRCMMDFAAAQSGRENLTTPDDMGELFYRIATDSCLGRHADRAMRRILFRQEDNCILPAQLPQTVQVAHKTGELDGIYHDCGIVWKPGAPYVCCLMASGIAHEAQAIYDLSYLARDIYDVM